MYGGIGVSAPSLHRESTDSLIVYEKSKKCVESEVGSLTTSMYTCIHTCSMYKYLFDSLAFLDNTGHLKLLPPDSVVDRVLLLQESEHVLLLLLTRWNGTGPRCFLLADIRCITCAKEDRYENNTHGRGLSAVSAGTQMTHPALYLTGKPHQNSRYLANNTRYPNILGEIQAASGGIQTQKYHQLSYIIRQTLRQLNKAIQLA